jgi:hypothetical protein
MKINRLLMFSACLFFGILFVKPYLFIKKRIINTLGKYNLQLKNRFYITKYDFTRTGPTCLFFKIKISKIDEKQILQRMQQSLFFNSATYSEKIIYFERHFCQTKESDRFKTHHTSICFDTNKNFLTFHECD